MRTIDDLTQEELTNDEFMEKFAKYQLSIMYDVTPSEITKEMIANYLGDK